MKKRFLAALLAAVMVMAMLPTAFAADTSGPCGDNVTWSYSDGTLTIKGTGPMEDYDFASYRPWHSYRKQIRNVSISDGVTSIGEHTFSHCENLTSVTIPDSVTAIGNSAFVYCNKLTSVTISNNVTTIENWLFQNCPSLTSVTIPNGVTTIGGYAFFECLSLTSVTIPDSVTSIGESAFYGCDNLTDVSYGGSESQWKQISIDTDPPYSGTGDNSNAPLFSATIHYGSASVTPETPTQPEPETPDVSGVPFTDVPEGQWYAAAVNWAVGIEITNGTNDGTNGQPKTFSPSLTCTQGQILTLLYRAARGEGTAAASDMDEAVSWALEKGMIDNDFDGSTPCTRATAMRYIWQAFDSPETDPADFTDVDADADYAAAVAWAVENGVTNGTNDGANGQPKTFSPDETCTRGHIVTFLHRAYVEDARLTVE